MVQSLRLYHFFVPTNSYGRPHNETLERLAKIGTIAYRTDETGATKICLKKGKMEIVGFKKRE